jgi:hypothetical protein
VLNSPLLPSNILAELLSLYPGKFPGLAKSIIDTIYGENAKNRDFGLTEFSVSLSSDGSPTLRCLAEFSSLRFTNQFVVQQGIEFGKRLFALVEKWTKDPLYDDIYEFVYSSIYNNFYGSNKLACFRHGCALEFKENGELNIKSYFSALSVEPEYASVKIKRVFELLGFSSYYTKLENMVQLIDPQLEIVGLSINHSPKMRGNLQVYMKGTEICPSKFNQLISILSNNQCSQIASKFNNVIFGAQKSPAQHLVRLSISFFENSSGNQPVIAWCIYLPSITSESDGTIASRIKHFCSMQHIDTDFYEEVIRIAAKHDNPYDFQHIHQYLSISFLPCDVVKLHVYITPLELKNSHMPNMYCPRFIKNNNNGNS